MNDLLEELLSAIPGVSDLIDSIEDKVKEALNIPDNFKPDLPLDGLAELDLDSYLPNFDSVLLSFRQELFNPIPNPIERIHKAVETATNKLNSEQPNSYDIKTVISLDSPNISFNCDTDKMPIVAAATYIGPSCIDNKLGEHKLIPSNGRVRPFIFGLLALFVKPSHAC